MLLDNDHMYVAYNPINKNIYPLKTDCDLSKSMKSINTQVSCKEPFFSYSALIVAGKSINS